MNKYVRKIICCLTIGALSLGLFSVRGDVFELQINMGGREMPVAFLKAEEFVAFLLGNPDNLPGGAIDPFGNIAPSNWQMLGYAVFFPDGTSKSQPVYVAKKRKYESEGATPITDHKNSVAAESFQHSTKFDHTERQLIAKILAKYNITPETRGSIHVFTEFPPCRNNALDNNNYPCTMYYDILASNFPNVQFHVYFVGSKFTMTKQSVSEGYITSNVLYNAIAGNFIKQGKFTDLFKIKYYFEANKGSFQKLATSVLLQPESLKLPMQWEIVGATDKSISVAVGVLNTALSRPTLSNQEKEKIFAEAYTDELTAKNINYHCI